MRDARSARRWRWDTVRYRLSSVTSCQQNSILIAMATELYLLSLYCGVWVLCVCVYVCVCVCVCVCMHVCMHVHVSMHACVRAYMHVCMQPRACVCVCCNSKTAVLSKVSEKKMSTSLLDQQMWKSISLVDVFLAWDPSHSLQTWRKKAYFHFLRFCFFF